MAIFQLFFFAQYRQGKVFYYILKRRNAFQGLTHGLGPKMAIFPTFFLGNIGQKNVFYDILERKNDFLSYKNKKFNKSKNWHFSKVVNPWFGSKNGNFSTFFFLGNICQKNVFYDILEQKKRLSKLWKQEVEKVEKLTFFQTG